jgi:hypothetical protein
MSESIENSFAADETREQAPQTERELSMSMADSEIGGRVSTIKDAALASMVFPRDK